MSTSSFTGRVALVTGATSGIGLATAQAFAERGAKVVLSGRREDRGEAAAGALRDAGHEAFFVQADVDKDGEVQALVRHVVERYGALDCAFNNAGTEGDTFVPLHEQSLDNLDRVFRTNVRSVLSSMKAEIRAMLEHGGGAIVNNASAAGLVGFGGMSAYSASKHAVVGLTRAGAIEYAPQGIRINAVAPGAIDTEMYRRFASSAAVQETIKSLHPVGRPGTPAEVASAVLWLCDPDNTFTAGTVLPVDGGYTAR
jgi:NAD(P)-dependent dehydrogenase (short-subunit alcohol dehydrogenase family)